jgi:hypothetical protein
MPVIAPALKAMSRPAARLTDAACAVRTLARTETFMPMKPAAPDRTAPIRKPMAAVAGKQYARCRYWKTTTPAMAMVLYCGLR